MKKLKKVLDSLVSVREHMRRTASVGTAEKLDEAIVLLRQDIKRGNANKQTTKRIMILLGGFLERLPFIVAILKLFE